MAHLKKLNGDAIRLIFDELDADHPESIKNLALVSKWVKEHTDPFRFRSIELSDDGPKAEASQLCVFHLLDTHHNVSKYARHITVSEFKGDKDWFKLERVVSELEYLRTFSWNAKQAVPECVISTVESRWPDAKLYVNNLRRLEDAVPLDIRLLSSPLLYSLTCLVFHYADYSRPLRLYPDITCSELEAVKSILEGNMRLKILRVKLCEAKHSSIKYWQHTAGLNLPIQPGDRLAPLQEFGLSYSWKHERFVNYYQFTVKHCRVLQQCLDLTQLRCLDLSNFYSRNFFKQFCGRVPNLQSLTVKFGGQDDQVGPGSGEHEPQAEFINFLDAIDSLEMLTVHNEANWRSFYDEAADANCLLVAVSKQARSLRRLVFRKPMCRNFLFGMGFTGPLYSPIREPTWTIPDLEALACLCKKLEHLEIDMDINEFRSIRRHIPNPGIALPRNIPCMSMEEPSKFTPIQSPDDWPRSFNRLRSLKILMEVPLEGTLWNMTSPPADKDFSRRLDNEFTTSAESLFRRFHECSPVSGLRNLELSFQKHAMALDHHKLNKHLLEWRIEVARAHGLIGALAEDEPLIMKKETRMTDSYEETSPKYRDIK